MKDSNNKDFYRKNWPLSVKLMQVDKTHCIHYGYYEKGIRTHIQSVLNMNDFVGSVVNNAKILVTFLDENWRINRPIITARS